MVGSPLESLRVFKQSSLPPNDFFDCLVCWIEWPEAVLRIEQNSPKEKDEENEKVHRWVADCFVQMKKFSNGLYLKPERTKYNLSFVQLVEKSDWREEDHNRDRVLVWKLPSQIMVTSNNKESSRVQLWNSFLEKNSINTRHSHVVSVMPATSIWYTFRESVLVLKSAALGSSLSSFVFHTAFAIVFFKKNCLFWNEHRQCHGLPFYF